MKQYILLFFGLLIICSLLFTGFIYSQHYQYQTKSAIADQAEEYWFRLDRRSNKEYLFHGVAGEASQSSLIKTFVVKVGIPGERPTPLPEKLGRQYWLITHKFATFDNPETAPYFLTLDIPYTEEYPFGPVPYDECDGQCNWQLPGSFGLHGVASNSSKLAESNPGSSGCIRHTDEDITYLYHMLSPEKKPIRYYIEDV
jgi:lipoprotein-anchoring transpeptidase ErfK/SrfK